MMEAQIREDKFANRMIEYDITDKIIVGNQLLAIKALILRKENIFVL